MCNKTNKNNISYNLDSWQKIHVTQLAYTRNLYLVMSFAAIGYSVKMIDNNIILSTFLFLAVISHALSSYFGIKVASNESENYRLKYKIARQITKTGSYEEKDEEKCTDLEQKNKKHLGYQKVFLLIGFGLLLIHLILYYVHQTNLLDFLCKYI